MPTGWTGARITKNNIGGVQEWMRQAVSDAMAVGVARVLEKAVYYCPVLSGDLAASGQVIQRGRLTFFVSFGEGLPDARAVYQEFGTAHHAAHPYITPALDEETASICEDIAVAVRGRVRHTNVRVTQLTNVGA